MGGSQLRVSTGVLLGNDFFNPLPVTALEGRRFDDNGITNDTGGWLSVVRDVDRFSLTARHRMITERGGGLRRTDELDLGFQYSHQLELGSATRLIPEGGVALALSGALGGMQLQDSIHSFMKGRRLNGTGQGQLQNLQPNAIRGGFVLSAGLTLEHDLTSWLTIGLKGSASLAVGDTGLSSANATMFAGIVVPLTALVSIDAKASVTAGIQGTSDPTLTLPGGYKTGEAFVSSELSAGISVKPVRVGFALRTNEGGSGANLGVVTLGFNF